MKAVIAAGAMTVMLVGCSSTSMPWSRSTGNFPPPGAAMAGGKPTGPPPKVADCIMIQMSSPAKYVCNAKVYTSFQLARMRADYEKQQQSGQ
jgi:hypothetical protein